MIVIVNKVIAPAILGRELSAAGIAHNGMSQFGDKLEILLVDEGQAEQVQAVLDAHAGVDTVKQRRDAAQVNAKAVPGWASWDEAQFLSWFGSNLSDAQVDAVANLADAKVMLKKQNAAIRAMGRLLIALRDRVFPDLEDGEDVAVRARFEQGLQNLDQ